jgi:endonuclease/exonuclease/phosphatase (EEP) superfamily protein YafD
VSDGPPERPWQRVLDLVRRIRLRGLCRVLAAALLAAAVVGLIAHLLDCAWLPIVVVATFAPYLLACAVPSGLLFLAGRAWPMAAVSAAVLVVALVLELPLYIATGGPADGMRLTMLTANLRYGHADAAALVATVRSKHVDVLTLQELTPDEVARLQAAGLERELPAHELDARPGAAGVGLWSRYSLAAGTRHLGFGFALVSARLVVGPVPVTVFAAHVQAPVGGGTAAWSAELSRLRDVLHSQAAGPVLVGGDFNSTEDHAPFRHLLSGGYHDAADQAGAGTARTYPADAWFPPLIGIDHVLTRGARALHVRTVSIPKSDHRGVLAQLVLTP